VVTGTGRKVGACAGAAEGEFSILSDEREEDDCVPHAVGMETAIPSIRIGNKTRMRITNISF
jgi:hypothetical protein